MSLRDEITHLRESILQRVELAARTGSARDVVDSSRLLEATEELLGSYNSLESRLQEIKSKVNGTQAVETIPQIPMNPSPTGLSAKAKGKQRRQAFLADAESHGIADDPAKGGLLPLLQALPSCRHRFGQARMTNIQTGGSLACLQIAMTALFCCARIGRAKSIDSSRASTSHGRSCQSSAGTKTLARSNSMSRAHDGCFYLDVPGSERHVPKRFAGEVRRPVIKATALVLQE